MNPFLFASLFTLLFTLGDYLIKGTLQPLYSILYFLLTLQPQKWFLYLLLIFTLFNQLFFSYFARKWQSSDIYNFFTHTDETLETFFTLLPLFYKALLLFACGLILLRFTPKTKPTKTSYANTLFLLLLALFTLPQFHPFVTLKYSDKNKTKSLHESIPPRTYRPKTDIILLLGESIKYDDYTIQKLKQLHPDFYTKIIAGATNTDVSVPLLLNAKTNPLHLAPNNQTNLFKLAKNNGFFTAFISIQSEKSLRYIKPYLQRKKIDFYKSRDKNTIAPEYDMKLLHTLQTLPVSKPRFIVMQQIGAHSPYIYYPGEKSDNPKTNYRRSIDYSFTFYQKLIRYLNRQKRPYILLFTSDHGEHTGKNGKWGHNSFAPTVYQVPFFIATNTQLPKNITRIKTHHDLSQMLIYLLGYGTPPEYNTTKAVVNGTMLTREDGYREITLPSM